MDREHAEEDDKKLEQLHLNAAQGKLRAKRKGLGLDFEDSDSEDDGYGRPKRAKKARKDNENIAALKEVILEDKSIYMISSTRSMTSWLVRYDQTSPLTR